MSRAADVSGRDEEKQLERIERVLVPKPSALRGRVAPTSKPTVEEVLALEAEWPTKRGILAGTNFEDVVRARFGMNLHQYFIYRGRLLKDELEACLAADAVTTNRLIAIAEQRARVRRSFRLDGREDAS